LTYTPSYKVASVTTKPLGDTVEIQLFDATTLLHTQRVNIPPNTSAADAEVLIEQQMDQFLTKYDRTVPILPDEEIAAA